MAEGATAEKHIILHCKVMLYGSASYNKGHMWLLLNMGFSDDLTSWGRFLNIVPKHEFKNKRVMNLRHY